MAGDCDGQSAPDNLLERAFMARIRADEYREALAALQREFDEREDVIALKRRIDRCEHERQTCIEQAKAAGISKQGSFRLFQSLLSWISLCNSVEISPIPPDLTPSPVNFEGHLHILLILDPL